jgi:hypothetical protein
LVLVAAAFAPRDWRYRALPQGVSRVSRRH